MKDLNFKPLFTKENSSFWLRTDMKFARTKTAELFDRVDKTPQTRYLKKILRVLPSECFIAGGAAKDLYTNNTDKIADIDIYSPNEEIAKKAYEALLTIKGEAVRQTKMAIAVNIKEGMPQASLIKIVYFDNMEHCLDSFDFTVCQFAVGPEESICNPMGLLDHQNKKLNIHVLQPQTDCLYRLVKYVNKGYQPTSVCLDTIHDFMSGNHIPVRNERPAPYGAVQISEALGSIPVISPSAFAYIPPSAPPVRPAPMTYWQQEAARLRSIEEVAAEDRRWSEARVNERYSNTTVGNDAIENIVDQIERDLGHSNIVHDQGPEPEDAEFRVDSAPAMTVPMPPVDTILITAPTILPANNRYRANQLTRAPSTRIIRGRGGLVQSSSGPRGPNGPRNDGGNTL